MTLYHNRKTGEYYFYNSLLDKWFRVIELKGKVPNTDLDFEFELTTEEIPDPRVKK
jgi:hypothetical protein